MAWIIHRTALLPGFPIGFDLQPRWDQEWYPLPGGGRAIGVDSRVCARQFCDGGDRLPADGAPAGSALGLSGWSD